MRRWVLVCPAVVAAACLPSEKAPDAGGGIDGFSPGFDAGPPYTGDARNDIAIADLTGFDLPGDGGAAPLAACPTATAAAGNQTVLIGWSDAMHGLIAMRADGSLVSVAPLLPSTTMAHDGDLQLWSAQTPNPDANGMYEAVLVDRAGNVRWRFERLLGPSEAGTVLFLDGRTGAAALGFAVPRTGAQEPPAEGVAIMPDGAVYELPGVTPNGPPRPDGWVPWITTMNLTVGHDYGFINGQTGENQPLHMPVLGTSGATLRDGVYVYRSWSDDGQAGLVVDDPAGATFYSTPIGSVLDLDKRLGLSFTTAGPLLTVDGRPRWLLRDMNELVDLGPLPGDEGGGTLTTMVGRGDWAFVRGAHMWSLQLSTGMFSTIPALPAPPPVPPMTTSSFGASVRFDDRWAMGTDDSGRIWRLDVASGAGGWLDMAPLRSFINGCGRRPPELLSDGTVAAGLRDDYTAGAYVRGPTETAWHRVGDPFVAVAGVSIRSVGSLLGVMGNPPGTYCPIPPDTWSPLPAGSEIPLRGTASEIVALPGPAAAFVNTGEISANPGNQTIQRSGACGLWHDEVHNVATGETFSFPAAYAVWW